MFRSDHVTPGNIQIDTNRGRGTGGGGGGKVCEEKSIFTAETYFNINHSGRAFLHLWSILPRNWRSVSLTGELSSYFLPLFCSHNSFCTKDQRVKLDRKRNSPSQATNISLIVSFESLDDHLAGLFHHLFP